ncbi:MAG: alpha/beta hydrolase-fold protein [Deinococcales bacterium]
MKRRLAVCAAASCVAVLFSLAAIAQTAERPIGTTIFQIGSDDDSDAEFTATGFSTDFTCHVGVDCTTSSFPRELEWHKGIGDYPAMGVTRATIDFELKESYPDLVLRLARTGVETLQVVVDGAHSYRVTAEMLGSTEGVVGTYNLDLGALPQGSHGITFTLVDEHRPDSSDDAFGWDALALIAPWDVTPSAHGRIEQIVVHGDSLEGDLLGDSPDRAVSVYLPPGYDQHSEVRYPALYLLHGLDATNTLWIGQGYLRGLNIGTVADTLISMHRMQPMIIVMPDASNRYGGSFYTDSRLTGNWDEFVAHDLVAYVDTHFRTIARPESRAIAGHDTGGSGALVLAMEHPDVYTVAYSMSPVSAALSDWDSSTLFSPRAFAETLMLYRAGVGNGSPAERLHIAMAAAFSPDLDNPPSFIDLPYKSTSKNPFQISVANIERVPAVWSEWQAHTALAMLADYGMNLLHYQGIGIDVGTEDSADLVAGAHAFDSALTAAAIPHRYEEYPGTHSGMVTARLATVVLPYVSAHVHGAAEAASR